MSRSAETASFKVGVYLTPVNYEATYRLGIVQPYHDPYQGSKGVIALLSRSETSGFFVPWHLC